MSFEDCSWHSLQKKILQSNYYNDLVDLLQLIIVIVTGTYSISMNCMSKY